MAKAKQVWIIVSGVPVAGTLDGIADSKTGKVRVLVPVGSARVLREHLKEPAEVFTSKLRALWSLVLKTRAKREEAASDAITSRKYHAKEERTTQRAYELAQRRYARESRK